MVDIVRLKATENRVRDSILSIIRENQLEELPSCEDSVMHIVERVLRHSSQIFLSWDETVDFDERIHTLLFNITADMLRRGRFHTTLGRLGPDGQQIFRLARFCLNWEWENGHIPGSLKEEHETRLYERIASTGRTK